MNSNTLTIKLGQEYKIRVEEISEFESSFFNGVYEKAKQNVLAIIENKVIDNTNKSEYENDDEYNNIIAFVSERGTGKSSSMVSFSKALTEMITGRNYLQKINLKRMTL